MTGRTRPTATGTPPGANLTLSGGRTHEIFDVTFTAPGYYSASADRAAISGNGVLTLPVQENDDHCTDDLSGKYRDT